MKIKALLTILIALLIGFVFGFITSGQIRKHEMKKKHKYSYHEVFVYKTLKVIGPSELQKDTLLPIIEEYAEKSLALKNNVSSVFDSLMRQMNEELRPFVTEDQFDRLKEEADKINYRRGR